MSSHQLPKVFITGASGFIGFELAQAYRRAGHVVYGLVRTAEKGRDLALNEILPVVGDVSVEGEWVDILKQCRIVVHCVVNFQDFAGTEKSSLRIITSALSSVTTPSSPALFIYTSGLLVVKGQASQKDPLLTDDSPLNDSEMFQPRVNSEKTVRALYNETNGSIVGVVVRPGAVYGKKSTHFYTYFEQAVHGQVTIKADPNIRLSSVHVDDLCAAYLLISSRPFSLIHSKVYNVVAPLPAYSNQEIAESFSKIAGYNGDITLGAPDGLLGSVQTNFKVDPVNITRLGWAPRHPPLLEEVDVLWARWKAANNLGL